MGDKRTRTQTRKRTGPPLLLLAALCGAWGLFASCAAPPAKVRRSSAHEKLTISQESSEAMAELLREALRDPGSSSSNIALGHFVEKWKQDCGSGDSGTVSSCGTRGRSEVCYHVRFDTHSAGCFELNDFDSLSPAEDYAIKGITHHRREGIGAPLAAIRENRHENPLDEHYPSEAITRALTAVIEPGPQKNGTQEVAIRMLCPLKNETVKIRGRTQPLAADFSVPWATLLARAGALKRSGIWDVLFTRMPKRKPGLFLMEPYDPDKEPLIMIHGLFSTPLTWAQMSNDLWAVDAIHQRYQIWHYLYNTSAPALYSARILRTQLRELRPLLDPEGDDPASQKMTLLTHSMGGIIGKAIACEPRDAYWKAALTVPPSQLKLSDDDRARLNEAFEWKADPTIHRIIFVAVPHQGSGFADNFAGRLGRWLTAPPSQFTEFYQRIFNANPGCFTQPYEAMWQGKLNSVSALSPKLPTLQILSKLPFAHPVQAHSIIGNRGKPGPLELSSDGIVPYTSSHIEGGVSELVVPAKHSAFRHPEALAEIKRILLLK